VSRFAAPADDLSWSVPGALVTPVLPGAEAFCARPLSDLLSAAAARDPAAIALTGLNDHLSYRDLWRLVNNAARAVAERVAPKEAVACLLPRRPDSIAVMLGCLIAGRPCMIIDAFDPPERRQALLADAAPALVISTEPVACVCPRLSPDAVLSGLDRTWTPDQVWDPDAPFAIHFTSGSTGRPKGIVLSARSVLYRAMFAVDTIGVTADSRMLIPSAPVAASGFAAMLGVLLRGARMVLIDLAREGASSTLQLIERESVTHVSNAPPTMRMLSRLRRSTAAFRSLRALRLGASALLQADLAELRTVLPRDCDVIHSYASTEAQYMAQWMVPADHASDEMRVPAGLLHLRHEYAIVDEDGGTVAAGAAGELMLRSQYVALGEWRDGRLVPGRMPAVPDRPGWRWFRTGDVVRVGADGMLRVLGRVDRQVKINGVLVQPAEIELVLKAEPAVIDAAVVASITKSGSVLHGFVAAEGDPAELVAGLRRRLAAHLPAAFRPERLVVLDRLPMLPGGKVDLVALANLSRT
jgi:acyl-coenzyme A synthetase/AMP-(fatty) acid ligase